MNEFCRNFVKFYRGKSTTMWHREKTTKTDISAKVWNFCENLPFKFLGTNLFLSLMAILDFKIDEKVWKFEKIVKKWCFLVIFITYYDLKILLMCWFVCNFISYGFAFNYISLSNYIRKQGDEFIYLVEKCS